MKSLAKGLHADLCAESLVWSCQSRIKFISEIALQNPSLIHDEDCFLGVFEVIHDVEQMLGIALEKLQSGVK